MRFFTMLLVSGMIVLLTVMSGCTTNPGSSPAPAASAGSDDYADCMKTCAVHTGQGAAECARTCCLAGCSETTPGGSEACAARCLGVTLAATPQGTATILPGTTPFSGMTSGFTCEYDAARLKTSPEYSIWFNTSCYYNTYCGWWEPVTLRVDPKPVDCVNCSHDMQIRPTPVPTPCPVRTIKPGVSPTPVLTTTAAASLSGTCSAGLTQCRVFSTDYCVDLMTDVKHCGACRKGCLLAHAENGCSGGTCYIKSCEKGWADCNGVAADGCEVDLNADDNNCGTCGKVCTLPKAGHAVCNGLNENGKCEVQYCATGWINANGIHEDGCEAPSN